MYPSDRVAGGAYGAPPSPPHTYPVLPRPSAPDAPDTSATVTVVRDDSKRSGPLHVAPPPPPTTATPSTTFPTKWIALSLLITSLVVLIITAYLSNNPRLSKNITIAFSFFTVASAAALLVIAYKGFADKKPRIKDAPTSNPERIGWVALSILSTSIIALLVIAYAAQYPLSAARIFYPTFGILGALSLAALFYSLIKGPPPSQPASAPEPLSTSG